MTAPPDVATVVDDVLELGHGDQAPVDGTVLAGILALTLWRRYGRFS
jgi:hypothetical protein